MHLAQVSGVNLRLFEAAGCGAAVLTEFRPTVPELFAVGRTCRYSRLRRPRRAGDQATQRARPDRTARRCRRSASPARSHLRSACHRHPETALVTPPGTPNASPGHLGHDAAMTRGTLRIALVMDHPAQHFARALHLSANEPGRGYTSITGSCPSAATTRSLPGRSRGTSTCSGHIPGRCPNLARQRFGGRRWLVRQLRKTRPDVVVCYGWAAPISRAAIMYCLLARTRRSCTGTPRGSTRRVGGTTWPGGQRWACCCADAPEPCQPEHSTANSISGSAWTRAASGRASVPRTPTCSGRRGPGAAACRPDDSELRIGFAGKLIARRGVDELIRAAALLPHARAWSVTVIGDGPLLAELRALTDELGLGDRVTFHGFAKTTDMPKLPAGFDVVVVPPGWTCGSSRSRRWPQARR